MAYDIFISYKRKSLATANNLYYRLTTRGYSVFFDLEEMGRDNFNVQLLNYIENAKDVTLATMEEEHNHSERVAPAIHHHPEDHLEESMLGKVEDLIATGYDGNLCFERDFLGEAMDMIGRFTVPSEIMDFRENK